MLKLIRKIFKIQQILETLEMIARKESDLHESLTEIKNELKAISPIPQKMLGREAIIKVLNEYEFNTVLDLGAGCGDASRVFYQHGKQVTAIVAYSEEDFPADLQNSVKLIVSDFIEYKFDIKYDLIWASHVLEHQRNVGQFLDKMWEILSDDGIAVITVPPFEAFAGGGHINSFSESSLIYACLLANFDLRDVRIKRYDYNLSIIVKKSDFPKINGNFANFICYFYDRLPKYIINGIERHIASTWNGKWGDERIPNDIVYKW